LRHFDSLYPEVAISGFSPIDHRIVFFTLVNSLLSPTDRVVDFGAGRGRWTETETGYRAELTNLKGRCAEVIGVDVDPAVLSNPSVDKALVIGEDGSIPLADESVDLIVSWAVFEHVRDPVAVAAELDRLLKPGGWICGWTPNKWGYIGVGARLVPNGVHAGWLKRLGVRRQEKDVFPVCYRMNTRRAIGELFPHYMNNTFVHTGRPSYHGGHEALARLIRLYGKLAPSGMGQALHVFLQKPV